MASPTGHTVQHGACLLVARSGYAADLIVLLQVALCFSCFEAQSGSELSRAGGGWEGEWEWEGRGSGREK